MSQALALSEQLMARASVTPNDAGCQQLIAEWLAPYGFIAEHFDFGETSNILLRHGDASPLLVFLGHTDVVPVGDEQAWSSPPFQPQVRDGRLYGRGACDMKTAVACFAAAAMAFVEERPEHTGSLCLLLTSDEEGDAHDGVVRIMPELARRGTAIDYCLIGEPSAVKRLGDTVKVGRRGSLNGRLIIQGKQGHIAYPHNVFNPIVHALPALAELAAIRWDEGNEFFPPTSWQISNIHSGVGASNVIPANMEVLFNFRYSTEQNAEDLQAQTEAVLQKHQLNYSLDWHISGLPFLSQSGPLRDAVDWAVIKHCGEAPEHATSGGTSDGRHVAPNGAEIVELGVVNESAHQVDEWVEVAELDALIPIYLDILRRLLP